MIPIVFRRRFGVRRFSSSSSIAAAKTNSGVARSHLASSGYLRPMVKSSSLYLAHLHWMLQKDDLKQDVLLVGPSSPVRRRLAMAFGEMVKRPVQVVTITSDLTESDLKQRRELKLRRRGDDAENYDKAALDLIYENASPVDAAIHGDILILDGIERASRNVLPTLNNLLEHRSMNLEDGRLLVPHHQILHHLEDGDGVSSSVLVPVHPDFRVIATAIPPGLAGGRPIDPPLRSRFQIRRIEDDVEDIVNQAMSHQENDKTVKEVAQFVMALDLAARQQSSLSRNDDTATCSSAWPVHQLAPTLDLIRNFPDQEPKCFLRRFYPTSTNKARSSDSTNAAFDKLYDETVTPRWSDDEKVPNPYRVDQIIQDSEVSIQSHVIFVSSQPLTEPHSVTLTVPSGLHHHPHKKSSNKKPYYCLTKGLESVITSMLQAHGSGHDILLLSPPGEGKSVAVSYFCSLLHYRQRLVHAHPEMTWTDLFLRRVTNTKGETSWESTALLQAIEEGGVCVLDHVQKLRPDVLAGLQSLCLERDVFLPDGRRITNCYSIDDNPQLVRVHPSFRLVALGTTGSWVSQESQGMFSTIVLPPPTADCYRAILHQTPTDSCPSELVDKLLHFHSMLTESVAADCGVLRLSTRNMIRIVRQLQSGTAPTDLHDAIWQVLVADLLPPSRRETLASLLVQAGIVKDRQLDATKQEEIRVEPDVCSIGDFVMPRGQVTRPERVPSPHFFDIPSHVRILKDLLSTWAKGERSFLLLGNQGVGKNVIVDRMCQLANFEREYIQLHRDSSIGQLTLQPTLEAGKVVWNDSPLVRAVTNGLTLVVDEADKAPTEVLAVLKGLVEDGELQLGDGRRISLHESGPRIIEMHPNFTLVLLANRPGFPFHGNAFFKQIGDCFSTLVVANPDYKSEIRLQQSYGPNVPKSTIESITASFGDLRSLSDQGDLSYPYSTREAVAVVKHLERYPDDGVVDALHNVLDFDSFDPITYGTLGEVFQRHGIPVGSYTNWQDAIRQKGMKLQRDKWGERVTSNAGAPGSTPPPLSMPKEGKWDANNEAHVGGNQWAGGTGGSDTAGLGGRGGPYRLDRGHQVHQVSDEAKAQVSAKAAEAARAMAKQALNDRLSEIDMSEVEWTTYHRFVESIERDINNLRAVFKQAQVKASERRWLTRQSHGELDEMRLVEGVTGSRNIYKRRSVTSNDICPSLQPKPIHIVVDVSGSMYRFNGYDGRLTRCLEAASLVMESLNGYEAMFEYQIVGHSGDSPCIPLVDLGKPPSNEKERLRVLQKMIAHAQYCQAGDHTLEALQEAIQSATAAGESEPSDAIVIAISDANLQRYGIHPHSLGRIIESGSETSIAAHCIFIASFGDEADEILRELPAGRGHICFQTSDLPRIVKDIIAAQVA